MTTAYVEAIEIRDISISEVINIKFLVDNALLQSNGSLVKTLLFLDIVEMTKDMAYINLRDTWSYCYCIGGVHRPQPSFNFML